MSADNYYVIKKHPKGGYAAVMGFSSDEATRDALKSDYSFPTPAQAFSWAMDEHAEYGVHYGPEVLDEILAPE